MSCCFLPHLITYTEFKILTKPYFHLLITPIAIVAKENTNMATDSLHKLILFWGEREQGELGDGEKPYWFTHRL